MAQDCLARGIVKGSSISLTPECLSKRRQMVRIPLEVQQQPPALLGLTETHPKSCRADRITTYLLKSHPDC